MLTRLEVDGFKNLLDLAVDLGPFNCIAGENAAGKSNLFDTIEFLSHLADGPIMEAAHQVRGTGDRRLIDPRELFWNGYQNPEPIMRLSAEMIVPHEVEDDFGEPANPTITFLRYELELGYDPPSGPRKSGRLALHSEQLKHINIGEAPRRLRFPHSAKHWRSQLLRGRRSGAQFISTEDEQGDRVVKIHQDGGSRGQPKIAAAGRSPSTVVSTTTQSSDPTILAARREMQSWRRLALEPSAMRAPDGYNEPQEVAINGRHISSALYRVAVDSTEPQTDVYARVAARLSALTGVRIRHLEVDEDDAREVLTLLMTERNGVKLSARSLSEGTLRFLALCVLLEDPTVTGILCMEEPENGVHPGNIPAMVSILEDLAVDAQMPPGSDNPLRQVIVNTHSPNVVQLVEPSDLLFADVSEGSSADEPNGPGLRLRPMAQTWRAERSTSPPVGKADLMDYLVAPPGAQLGFSLPQGSPAA